MSCPRTRIRASWRSMCAFGGRVEKRGSESSRSRPAFSTGLLTPGDPLLTLPALFCERSGGRADHHETHLSAEQDQAQTRHRVPRTYEDDGWQESSCAPSIQRPQENRSLTPSSIGTGAMQPTAPRLRLGAESRLRSKLEFDAIYARGRRIDDRFFGLRVMPNGRTRPRVGLAVAVKTMG